MAGGVLERAAEFVWSHARTLERRLFQCLFEDGDPEAVADAVRAFRNPDGGLGHALEADLRGPESQPIHVEFGLQTLYDAGAVDRDWATEACDYLVDLADPDGLVPQIRASALEHAHADHWQGENSRTPSLPATLGIAGLLHWQGVRHPWLDRATRTCWDRLATDPPAEAHGIRSAFLFCRHAGGEARAAVRETLAARLFTAQWFTQDVPVTTYTLTPLHFATGPDTPERAMFEDAVIEAHLADLQARQEEDGGWPVVWNAPSEAAKTEWRGRWTIEALLTLRRYGRI